MALTQDSGLLTPIQQKILSLLASGQSIKSAAEAAGIHRNTIFNWRRSSVPFRDAWQIVQDEQNIHWRDEMQSIAPIAVETIRQTLTGGSMSPSVRLRAALAVIDRVLTPPTEPPLMCMRPGMRNEAQKSTMAAAPPVEPYPKITHKKAQTSPTASTTFVENKGPHYSAIPKRDPVIPDHKIPFRRSMPKQGRNELCACGSGLKHKRCCLSKPVAA